MIGSRFPLKSAKRAALIAFLFAVCVFLFGCSSSANNAEIAPGGANPAPPTGFVFTGSMNLYREGDTATLLNDGTVLIYGGGWQVGYTPTVLTASGGPMPIDIPAAGCEIYSPSTGTFATLFDTQYIESTYHTATLLQDGTVLIAGGSQLFPGRWPPAGSFTSAGVIFYPATRSVVTVGNMSTPREEHTATLLNNGTVLIVGGAADGEVLASAELYNPATQTFTLTGSLNYARFGHTATLLSNGTVLISGGSGPSGQFVASAELYDPSTESFTVTGSLNVARVSHAATLLNDGSVLITGGVDSGNNLLSSAELYNPGTGMFTVTGTLNTAREWHSATMLDNGMVLIAGGSDASSNALSSAELYDPTTGLFNTVASLNTPRFGHTATLLPNGSVLLAGGTYPDPTVTGEASYLSSAEIY